MLALFGQNSSLWIGALFIMIGFGTRTWTGIILGTLIAISLVIIYSYFDNRNDEKRRRKKL